MNAIILRDADDVECADIIKDKDGLNMVFRSVDEADLWLQFNAKVGWCTRIIDLDN